MKMDTADNRKKHIILTQKAYNAEPAVKDYMADLVDCLLQAIPERSLPGIETALQTILDNIQPETIRRSV